MHAGGGGGTSARVLQRQLTVPVENWFLVFCFSATGVTNTILAELLEYTSINVTIVQPRNLQQLIAGRGTIYNLYIPWSVEGLPL